MDLTNIENLDFKLFCSSSFTVVSTSPYIVKNGYNLALIDSSKGEINPQDFSLINTVCAHSEDTAKTLISLGYERGVTCFQFAYLKDFAPQTNGDLQIKVLDESYLPFVEFGYGGGDYAKRLLKTGKIYGGFNGEVPIGFIGVHDANTIGLIFVSPEHRKKGYAKELLSFAVNLQLSKGLTPLTQVAIDNTPSIRLHESIGFTKLQTKTIWLKK